MKGTKGFGTRAYGTGGPLDLGSIFDEIFEAARDFHNEFRENYDDSGCHSWLFNENTDYYPNYSYPPMNVFMTGDRSLVFEFALAGFDEKDISLSFQGDYMVFSAAVPRSGGAAYSRETAPGYTADESPNSSDGSFPREDVRFFKRRLKMKDIEKQKYFVPLDKYAQENVKAVYRNGILRVTIPPKEEPDQNDGIRIEILTD